MLHLLVNLLERLGLFAIAFILVMRFAIVKRFLIGKASRYEKLTLSVLFGFIGIAGTYMGVPIQNAIANSRVVGVALGGILGGPLVGFGAGLIAGGHRFLIDVGGFTATACGVATIAEGVAGGLIYHRLKRGQFDPAVAFITGVAVETLQMVILLVMAKPFTAAVSLVSVIGFPMILVNSIGLALFVELVSSVFREKERFAAVQAQTALNIALRTLPFLRGGLTEGSAAATARIIREMTDLDAVAITDEAAILAHTGAEEDHHRPGLPLLTASTRSALASGEITTPLTRDDIGCTHEGCRLGSAIIVPLKKRERTVGALKLYRLKEGGITPLDMELANGLAHLFSNQLEISELEAQRKLVREAEIRALQAQINPHFLFNTINTIISYTRTSPETASDLLVKLADFFRRNINPGGDSVPLATELEHCRAYIAIEKARFEDRLRVVFDVDEEALGCKLPTLTLQPLVENALKHGILPREEGGEIRVGAHREGGVVRIVVGDNGVGMPPEQVARLFSGESSQLPTEGAGIALNNVNARLSALYGPEHALRVESTPGAGTTVSFTVPQGGRGEYAHESLHR
ncbi:signal transduction histidine kinase, LytS [Geobacter metallireducens RCH3]|uniref:histidine kinase n=1 Tax=Geobacter metallireducens (strain ATCC 53774 / DSM 7210 / GS-15) TaxID=269799 RepID=Q39S58_GEOMG|nr:sensor histidine kinase [Geobacter metallireducens]ABB32916.1 sensor histidine kinase LytS, GAF domain-containing [Geobacter metallireducens GS-15]EHP88950.1 signal transduction histidine kinase, LytS [Geobacter metallireducens RCH3]